MVPRITRWVFFAAIAIVGVELLSFTACVLIQRFDYRKWSQALRPLPWLDLADRTGFLYQNQEKKAVWIRDPLLQFRLRPYGSFGSFSNVVVPGLNDLRFIRVGPTGFVKNNSNLNDPEPILPNDRLVFVTGGSPVAGEDLTRNEDAVPSQLEQWLRDRCRKQGGDEARIRVVNAGAPAYSSAQELTYFLFNLGDYHPLVWAQLTGINEPWHFGMLNGGREIHEGKYPHSYPETNPLTPYFLLPATQKLALFWLPMLVRPGRFWLPEFWHIQVPSPAASTAQHFLDTLVKSEGAAEAAGVRHYVFLQPTAESDTLRSLTPQESFMRDQVFARGTWQNHRNWALAFYSELRPKFAAQHRTRWFDLIDSFAPSETHDVYVSPRHFSPYGAGLMAEKMGKQIWLGERARLCPAARPPR